VGRRIVWTTESRWWLREIYDYIQQDSQATALNVVRSILEKARLLLEFPELGHIYEPARGEKVRVLLYGHYRIVYQPAETGELTVDIPAYLADVCGRDGLPGRASPPDLGVAAGHSARGVAALRRGSQK